MILNSQLRIPGPMLLLQLVVTNQPNPNLSSPAFFEPFRSKQSMTEFDHSFQAKNGFEGNSFAFCVWRPGSSPSSAGS